MVLSNQNVSLFRNKISVDKAVKIQLCLGRWGSSNPLGMCPSNEVSLETGTHGENPTGQEGGGQNGTAQTRAEQTLEELAKLEANSTGSSVTPSGPPPPKPPADFLSLKFPLEIHVSEQSVYTLFVPCFFCSNSGYSCFL